MIGSVLSLFPIHVTESLLHSFLWLNDSPLHTNATFYLSTSQWTFLDKCLHGDMFSGLSNLYAKVETVILHRIFSVATRFVRTVSCSQKQYVCSGFPEFLPALVIIWLFICPSEWVWSGISLCLCGIFPMVSSFHHFMSSFSICVSYMEKFQLWFLPILS